MELQTPTMGPIVGYTNTNSARIWLRGKFQPTDDGYSRCFGAVRVKQGAIPTAPVIVKMPPYFDMTGVAVIEGLEPDTEYEYEAGWFFSESELEDFETPPRLEWNHVATGRFRTSPASADSQRSYVVGSCRYLLRLFGGSIFDERGDKIFQSIQRQIDRDGLRTDALVMLGDQIYADDLNLLSPDNSVDEFLKRYRDAFGQKHIRRLMSQLPTYMMLDDHEIEDNWPSRATPTDRLKLYPAAAHAYQIYQASHSPLFEARNGSLNGTPDHFWYTFSDGCCDWFMLDCRTERHDDNGVPTMLSTTQRQALYDWLSDGSGRVKMIGSSIPFFPDLQQEADDKWTGYASERTEILEYIAQLGVTRVVFVSGDVHCSFVSELTSPTTPGFKVFSVVSSSFFWPYPHMTKKDFVLDGQLQSSSARRYQVTTLSDVHSTDNFCRLGVTPEGISVSYFDRKGKLLAPEMQGRF